MTQNMGEFADGRKRRFDWAAILPKRQAWIQTLILLPFGLPVASFLGSNWNFSVNAITEEQQYPVAVISLGLNLLLPSLFFAFLFHWGWYIWKQSPVTWYPNRQALSAGLYATGTVAVSFAIVELFNQTVGVCGNGGWGEIGENLFCNLNGYGFESKSWFGVWFIIAAYCYQAQGLISSIYRHYLPSTDVNNFTSPTAPSELATDDFGSNPLDITATSVEE
ncbi:MAG: hypothetical protein LH474_05380 [Chamaesiphon sp.]|nr:hypothetical protein [Chamaesiphon sp.]